MAKHDKYHPDYQGSDAGEDTADAVPSLYKQAAAPGGRIP